ncbi:alcohol dehydrogenase catalytic domain-containing protein [uncultured Desulfobacter sp.]|uniref:alcohol dehydrogenase catalytic domain-containing protein n=1 Tax=uncultured Desulfobacter sp. TaxID=240139 RepID=UPI0029C654BA|nr:alcohol dehydrogenase catalytic domain-containing protein [uncultured Desulfobacter sp.]
MGNDLNESYDYSKLLLRFQRIYSRELNSLSRRVKPGHEFIQATPLQILEEEKYLLENLTDFNTFYWGDHGNNIVSSKGRLPEHREWKKLIMPLRPPVLNTMYIVDTMIRQMGEELPMISPQLPAVLGMDFAGIVDAVGQGVTEYAAGDEVYGCAGGLGDLPGTLAEYMVADANLIARKPEKLTMREAAALPLVGITAYEGLTRAGIVQGQKVLVHGGSGGVGHIALAIGTPF